MRRLAVTAIALHVIASFLLLSVLRHSPLGRRRPIQGRTAADVDAERRRLARQRAAIEGHQEPGRTRIPYATLVPAADDAAGRRAVTKLAAIPALVLHLGRRTWARRPGAAMLSAKARHSRLAVPAGMGFLALLVASASFIPVAEPMPATARPPTVYTPLPVTATITPITVDHEPDSPIVIEFSSPMNRDDVEARLRVEPGTEVRLTWSADGRQLTVEAVSGWTLGGYYTLTIPAGALDAAGAALAAPVRAAFLVRGLTAARITAPRSSGGLALLDTPFVVSFDRPVDMAVAAGAFAISPAVAGAFSPASGSGQQLTFTPAARLLPDTAYTLTLADGLLDAAGSPVQPIEPVVIRTVPHPGVRSTSPIGEATGIATTARISVRFSRPMEPEPTLAAISVTIAGRAVAGLAALADGGRLLTFQPSAGLPLGAVVSVRVAAGAASADGLPLQDDFAFTFTVRTALDPDEARVDSAARASTAADAAEQTATEERLLAAAQRIRDQAAKAKAAAAKAAAAARKKALEAAKKAAEAREKAAEARRKAAAQKDRTRQSAPKSKPIPKPSSGSSSWVAVEAYYLNLVNCTRTGGWVQKNGSCTGAGSRKGVKPLKLDAGISAKVSRPYARKLALAGACTHFSGGSPAARLRSAGFRSHRWAENLSCPPGMTPEQTAVYSIRYFQNEKPYNGGHYRNLMNPTYDRAGIGIWAARGRVIIVSNFYRP